jgi:hypothetical protein
VPEGNLYFFNKIKESGYFNHSDTRWYFADNAKASLREKFESKADIGGKESFCSSAN